MSRNNKDNIDEASAVLSAATDIAEKGVLGSVLIDPLTITLVKERLTVDDFCSAVHRIIAKVMFAITDADEEVNPISVLQGVQNLDEGEQKVFMNAGGFYYLQGLSGDTATASLIDHYIKSVKAYSGQRKLIPFANRLLQLASTKVDDVNSAILQASEELSGLADTNGVFPWKNSMESVRDAMAELLEDNRSSVIRTGFVDLDAIITGLIPGALTVLAARPGVGKTALALNIMVNACIRNHIPTGIFTLEMRTSELVHRMVSNYASINASVFKTHHLTEDEWSRYAEASEIFSREVFAIDQTPAIDISVLTSRAKQMAMQYGIKLLIIDYIQLMQSNNDRRNAGRNREQEVADISKKCKCLAKNLNIPVLLLAQLNRGLEQRADKRPVLSDLRESGSIEQDADNVIFIHKESKESTEAEIIIAKQRSGPQGTIKLQWTGEYVRFDNYMPDGFGANIVGGRANG